MKTHFSYINYWSSISSTGINRIILIGVILCLCSCEKDKQLAAEIDSIPITIKVDRFDQKFAKADTSNWKKLKADYPYFFPEQYDDAFWLSKLTDTIQQEINQEVHQVFPNDDYLNEELTSLFKHINYYYPPTAIPKVYTITSERDYKNRVIYTDSLLLLALDNYLGPSHHFYYDIAVYQAKNLKKENIVVDVALDFSQKQIAPPHSFTFMEAMIYEGKKRYLSEQLLSLKPTSLILGYTEDEYAFAKENEVNVWEYFVSKELLFSTDRKLLSRFLRPAPFSKFYLELDNETPGQLGVYIGYKIVSAYMQNTNIPLKTMLAQTAETIFNNAKYKP